VVGESGVKGDERGCPVSERVWTPTMASRGPALTRIGWKEAVGLSQMETGLSEKGHQLWTRLNIFPSSLGARNANTSKL